MIGEALQAELGTAGITWTVAGSGRKEKRQVLISGNEDEKAGDGGLHKIGPASRMHRAKEGKRTKGAESPMGCARGQQIFHETDNERGGDGPEDRDYILS